MKALKDMDIAELHDEILAMLYKAAAWDDQAVRKAAYHVGADALSELLNRAADPLDAAASKK